MGISKEELAEASRIEKIVCEYLGAKHIPSSRPFDGMLGDIPVEVKHHKIKKINLSHIKRFKQSLRARGYGGGYFAAWSYTPRAQEHASDLGIKLFWLEDIFQKMELETDLSHRAVAENQKDICKQHYLQNKEEIERSRKEFKLKNPKTVAGWNKKYKDEHREEIAKKNKIYCLKNKEKGNACKEEWAKRNKDKRAESCKKWAQKNKEKVRAYSKKWKAANRDRINAQQREAYRKKKLQKEEQ